MRRILIVLVGVLVWASTAAPALASHTHVMMTGNGGCVILAASGEEKKVQLPYADGPENRRHPLHVNVHLGQPGMRQGEPVIWVQDSPGDLANCDGYVND